MRVVAVGGGTGSAKLLRGLQSLKVDLTVVGNVGDNIWIYGAYVCPDLDISCYSMAGMAASKGWGIDGDTFEALDQIRNMGVSTWFRLGDRDLATCLVRTEMIRAGASLTEATEKIRKALGVRSPVLPVTDDPIETRLETSKGDLHLQEFWVRESGGPDVTRVYYAGAEKARVTDKVAAAVAGADRVVICPANPVTSISPSLAVPGFEECLSTTKARVVALSPMIGSGAFSGPAAKLMKSVGVGADSAGVAGIYSRFLDAMLIAKQDAGLVQLIEAKGVECVLTDTSLASSEDEQRLARELVAA